MFAVKNTKLKIFRIKNKLVLQTKIALFICRSTHLRNSIFSIKVAVADIFGKNPRKVSSGTWIYEDFWNVA